MKLRALFENADERLFPNQFVNARLELDTVRDAALVPAVAIQRGQPGTFVYLMEGDDTVRVRPVTLAETDGTSTVVAKGLSVGDRVVVDGADRLRDGASVRLAGEERPRRGGGGRHRHGGEAEAPDARTSDAAPALNPPSVPGPPPAPGLPAAAGPIPAPGTVQGATQSPAALSPGAAGGDAQQGAPTDRPRRGEGRRRDGPPRGGPRAEGRDAQP